MKNNSNYKQTEIGLIPEEWDVKTLGEIGKFSKGQGVKKNEALSGDIPCIRYGEIYTRHNNYIKQFYSFISHEISLTAKKLNTGDLLFAGSGETKEEIGKCVAFIDNIEAFVGGDVVILSPIKTSSLYLGYLLNYPLIQKQKASRGQGDAVVHISATQLASIKIPVPPLAEQSRIAAALSDADALISSLEALIAKKRDIKQGAMQTLLQPKDGWEVKRLGEVVTIRKGEQLNKSDMSDKGTYPALNGGIEPSGYTDKWNTDKDTITISEGGNSCGFVNYNSKKFWLGGHCYAINLINTNFSKLYLYQYLKFRQQQIMELRVGSGLPNIQKTGLNNFIINIEPSIAEQQRIAAILSAMDGELSALEGKLEKYQALKLGMMQNLLTGKIRLPFANSIPDPFS